MMQMALFSTLDKSAVLSECRTFRYELRRVWDDSKGLVNIIGLNPSTADETEDDRTINRCMTFARDWGYGGLIMTNAYAFRATNPEDLLPLDDPIGPENDTTLLRAASESKIIVCAWGVDVMMRKRQTEIARMLANYPLHCFRKTKSGAPEHPLYLPKALRPIPWEISS